LPGLHVDHGDADAVVLVVYEELDHVEHSPFKTPFKQP
jgi:hypothetical protein